MDAAKRRAQQAAAQRRFRDRHGEAHRAYQREWIRRDRCIKRLAAALRLVEQEPAPEFTFV